MPDQAESVLQSATAVAHGGHRLPKQASQRPRRHNAAVTKLFETLDLLEERLATRRYLLGDRLTEADWRLFTTLVRFDPVYVSHFKCNLRRIVYYPNLFDYLRHLYQMPGIAETVNMFHIKHHYYQSHRAINPTGIVPLGPEIDLNAPSRRG